MRYLILLLILLATYNFSFATPSYFNDLAKDHWANSAVYDLIKKGITSGYPDGTFRGEKSISRYEAAVFFAKLAEKGKETKKIERLLAELKTEFYAKKYQIENPDNLIFSGSYSQQIINKGPTVGYRFKGSLHKTIGQSGNFTINADTTDAGYGGTTRNIATNLFDIETNLLLGKINYKATTGPDKIIYRDTSGINPSDDYKIFQRPRTSFSSSTFIQNLGLSLEYISHQTSLTGEGAPSEINGQIVYTYKKLPLLGKTTISVQPRYLYNNSTKSALTEFVLSCAPTTNGSCQFLFGAKENDPSKIYIKVDGEYKTDRTKIKFTANKVGENYRQAMDQYEFVGLNSFNKLIVDGTCDIALELFKMLNNNTSLDFKTDMVMTDNFQYGVNYAGTTWTSELGLKYFSSNILALRSFYRIYSAPSGLSSPDANIAISVPIFSDLIGIEATISL